MSSPTSSPRSVATALKASAGANDTLAEVLSASSDGRASLFADFANGLYYVDESCTIQALVCLKLSPDLSQALASFGDSFDMKPVQLSLKETVLTLVPISDVKKWNLPNKDVTEFDPTTLPNPDGETARDIRFPTVSGDAESFPQFALLPKTMPMRAGYSSIAGNTLSQPLPNGLNADPMAKCWFNGLRYLFSNNEKLSLKAVNSTLFSQDSIDMTGFESFTLSETIVSTPSTLDIMGQNYELYQDLFAEWKAQFQPQARNDTTHLFDNMSDNTLSDIGADVLSDYEK